MEGKDLMEIISNRSMYADIEELKDKGGAVSEEEDLPRSRFDKDRRERTAILYEDRDESVEREHHSRYDRNRQKHSTCRNNEVSNERNSEQRSSDSWEKIKKGNQQKHSERNKSHGNPRLSLRSMDKDDDNFWKRSGHEIYDRENKRNTRFNRHDKLERNDSRDRNSPPRHFNNYRSEREKVQYKTIGDECKEVEAEDGDMGSTFRGSGFRGRRPFRGRPFVRRHPFMMGRPFRGRGVTPFMETLPMMPVVNPFYATLMQEFLHETGFQEWLKKKAKSHSHRRHSMSSSRSSRSHSRSRSKRSRRKHRRHSSSTDRGRSRSRRSRSYSRRRHSSYSCSRSRSHSRSYSRSRSRSSGHRSRSRRHRSNSDRSERRSRSRSSSKNRSSSKHRRRSYSKESTSSFHSHKSRSKSKTKSRSRSVSKDKSKTKSQESKPKKSEKTKSEKHKQKKKTAFKNSFQSIGSNDNEEVSESQDTFERAEEIGELVAFNAESFVKSGIVEATGDFLENADNFESISSDNGQEWSSEEEGEV